MTRAALGVSFHLGSSRLVLALPRLGIVLKVPRLRIRAFGAALRSALRGRHPLRRLLRWARGGEGRPWSPRRLLVRGFAENWRE